MKHIGIVAAGVLILLGLPFFTSDYFAAQVSGVDVTSSATVILDAPSGDYVVLINQAMHPDREKLEDWTDFFSGEEVSYIFEDISCSVADGDSAGLEMARSYQSRLPENQMKLSSAASTLLLSRIGADQFDIVVMSKEFADSYGVTEDLTDNAIMIRTKGASE